MIYKSYLKLRFALCFAQEGSVMGIQGKAEKRASWERGIYHNLTMISGVPGGKPRHRRRHKQSTHEKKGINSSARGYSSSTANSYSGYRSTYSRGW